jgi:uncharacterized membrane-anchored protein YhcB (DUF1043 family)
MGFLMRALTFYAWYVAAVSVVFSIVLGVLFLTSTLQRWANQRELEVLQALRRRSELER